MGEEGREVNPLTRIIVDVVLLTLVSLLIVRSLWRWAKVKKESK
jgi:hypothetical protein